MSGLSTIGCFAQHCIWNAKESLFPITIAIPAALVAIQWGKKAIEDKAFVKNKIETFKMIFKDAYTLREGEDEKEFQRRIRKNYFLTISATLLFAAIIGGSIVCPIMVLPPYLAILPAISAIKASVNLLAHHEMYYKALKGKLKNGKSFLKEFFIKKENESYIQYQKRAAKAIGLFAIGAGLMLGCVASAMYGFHWVIQYAIAHKISIWNLYNLIPLQTPLGVFLEYATVGVLHTISGMKKFMSGKKKEALFHFVNAALSFIFPIFYYLTQTKQNPMRLHHSILGLGLSLMPSTTLKTVGTYMTLDSALYFFVDKRGYFVGKQFKEYDYQNFFLDNLSSYVSALSSLVLLERKEKASEVKVGISC